MKSKDNTNQNTNNGDTKDKAKTTLTTITNTPPFGSDTLISPLDMHDFIVNMYNILLQSSDKLPEITGLRTQFATLQNSISGSYNDWQQFISSLPPESGAHNYRDHVPYVHANPYTSFLSLFPGGKAGSPQGNAMDAMSRLMKMVETTSYALELMKRSPQLMSIFKDFIPIQLERAKNFMTGLRY